MLSEMILRPLVEILNDMPFTDIEKWLFEKLEVDSRTIKTIKRKYSSVFNKEIDKKTESDKIKSHTTEYKTI